MRFSGQRGAEDVLPGQSHAWQWIEAAFRETTRLYGYREIRTPVFEDYELFVRSSGETSEVVGKQMYDFTDKGGRHIALKPESTAPAMRSLIEHNLCPPGGQARLSYVSSAHYRYERPQKGRLREHHQMGIELVGVADAAGDAEVIEVGFRFLERIGLGSLIVRLNSIGRSECRAAFRQVILDKVAGLIKERGEEFANQAHSNPLRLLDTKDAEIRATLEGLPSILDYLEPECLARFAALQTLLNEAGIPFEVAPDIVRGLDYYTETVFEVHSADLGAQSTVLGGGRYDNLVKELGGSELPAVGFGSGVERLLLVLEAQSKLPAPAAAAVFVVWAPEAAAFARRVSRRFREAGLEVGIDLEGKSFKSQFRQADKSNAPWVIVLGEDEVAGEVVSLKEMASGEQKRMTVDAAIERMGSGR